MRIATLGIAVLAACGGGGNNNSSNMPDALILPPCDYTEATDATNDTMAEMTSITLGALPIDVCGTVNNGHFNGATNLVDQDTYRITLAAPTDLLVQFVGASGIETVGQFSVLIFDTAALPTLLAGGNLDSSLGDHGVYLTSLPAGTFDFVVDAKNTADLAAPIDYKVRITADMPATRCPTAVMTPPMPADYTESMDTATNDGNDVFDATFATDPPFALTTATTDNPEPTGLTVDTGANKHITGISGAENSPDDYQDHDTYEITTGMMINELSIRLDWPGATADLDYAVFEAASTTETASSLLASNTGPEFDTFAVKPATKYWVWVAAHDGSTGQPITYDLNMCATQTGFDASRQ